jgi:hypothetical protein
MERRKEVEERKGASTERLQEDAQVAITLII